jgi:NTE family protein
MTATSMGLILTGGGARAAYQVGVLQEIMSMGQACGADRRNPFDVVCGTSAGAINASMLACGADQFAQTLDTLVEVWRDFRAHQVYRSEVLDMVRAGTRWMALLSVGWLISHKRLRPKSLLDNAPLGELLHEHIDFRKLPGLLSQGHLKALAVTASNYSNGEHVTFYQSHRKIEPWVRNQRVAVQCELSHTHLLASSGIPFVFPAACLEGPKGPAWFGDGAMRQTAPISPAIHLGANKVLVIGAGRMHEPQGPVAAHAPTYPSMANIAGHALSSIFLDALSVDVERLERINQTLTLIPPDKRTHSSLRPVELLVVSPSERLDTIALNYAHALPATVQRLLKTLGASKASKEGQRGQSGALLSYLLFESVYTQELMALGRADARKKSSDICRFFGWTAPAINSFSDPSPRANSHATH